MKAEERSMDMAKPTEGKRAELVGHTGHEDWLEVRRAANENQVWAHGTTYPVPLGRVGYWVGSAKHYSYAGPTKDGAAEYCKETIGTPVRWGG